MADAFSAKFRPQLLHNSCTGSVFHASLRVTINLLNNRLVTKSLLPCRQKIWAPLRIKIYIHTHTHPFKWDGTIISLLITLFRPSRARHFPCCCSSPGKSIFDAANEKSLLFCRLSLEYANSHAHKLAGRSALNTILFINLMQLVEWLMPRLPQQWGLFYLRALFSLCGGDGFKGGGGFENFDACGTA